MLLNLPGNGVTRCSATTHIVLRNRRYERAIDADYRVLPSHRLLPAMPRHAATNRKPRLPAGIALLAVAIALVTWTGPMTELAVKPIQPQVVMQT
jgi:hypothetical protein